MVFTEVREKAEEWRLNNTCSRPHKRWAIFHHSNSLIRFPRITKNMNFILLIGTKNSEANSLYSGVIEYLNTNISTIILGLYLVERALDNETKENG